MTPLDIEIENLEKAIQLIIGYRSPKYTRAYYDERARINKLMSDLGYWKDVKQKLESMEQAA